MLSDDDIIVLDNELANKVGITRDNFVGVINMPNSREFNIVYWKQYEQSNM